jgi:hypothetical protein
MHPRTDHSRRGLTGELCLAALSYSGDEQLLCMVRLYVQ